MPRRPDDDQSWRPHDTDRSIDPFDGPPRASRAPASRPPVPPPSRPGPARRHPARSARRGLAPRTLLLAGGGVLAVVATVLVFLTDDPDLLRVAVVAAAWAFVLATFVAGRRSSEEAGAAVREAALRRTYEYELEREVAARREYELELENELRRDADEAMRTELDGLRRELSAVSELRSEVARVADLRDDVAALSALREEVARVAALRDDVLALTALRSEIGQVGELRTELGRLRAELAEQLSSEMLVERIVMRTQASRLTGGDGALPEAPAGWRDEPPRELTGGWPAVRLEEHTSTQQYERVRVDRSPPPQPWPTVVQAAAAPPAPQVPPAYTPPPVPQAPRPPEPGPATRSYALDPAALRGSRHAASAEPAEPAPSPREWLASRSLLDSPAPPAGHEDRYEDRYDAPLRRRTDDGSAAAGGPDDLVTTERPAAPGNGRLEQILAENGARPATGSRRRRRYRDEDEVDDVLSRVLRGD